MKGVNESVAWKSVDIPWNREVLFERERSSFPMNVRV